MGEIPGAEKQIATAEDVRQEAIRNWGYQGVLLRADAALVEAIAARIELGLVNFDPHSEVSKIHRAIQSAMDLLR